MNTWGDEVWENLAHQIVLLAIDPRTGRVPNRQTLALVAAAGVLGELALQERVSLVDQKVQLSDARPTEEPLLDLMLASLAAEPGRRPVHVLIAARRVYLAQCLSELVDNGWVQISDSSRRFAARYQVVDPERVERIRRIVAAALRDPEQVPARTACLGGLAAQLFWPKDFVPEMKWWPRMLAKAKLENRDWVVKALSQLVSSQQHPG